MNIDDLKIYLRIVMKSILISGASGFIASNFCKEYSTKYKCINLSHRPQSNSISLEYLTQNLQLVKEIDIVLNLAGANLGNKRWSLAYKNELLLSRINTTQTLVKIFNQHNPNAHFLSTSAIGIYDFNTSTDEKQKLDYYRYSTFSQEITKKWELEALNYKGLLTITRLGVVLSSKGGAFGKILLPFRFGVGGRFGDGTQPFSWIGLSDLLLAFEFIIDNSLTGIFNLNSPQHIDNQQLVNLISQIWHKPKFINFPSSIIKLIWGQMGDELLLNGCYADPTQLLEHKFIFKYPVLKDCLQAIQSNLC